MTKRTSRRWGETVLRGVVWLVFLTSATGFSQGEWEQWFRDPPPRYRPEVYWDWMGGLISREGITKDLEALQHAGVGGVLIMQMPDQLAGVVQWRFRDYPGKVKCLSDEWFAMMNHAAKECDRLGLRMSFLMCPGWSHCGGPWITPEKGLKMLVTSRTAVSGPSLFDAVVPRAAVHKPGGGDCTLPDVPDAAFWRRKMNPTEDFYRDVAVVAVPAAAAGKVSPLDSIVELTQRMDSQGRLKWDVPAGQWIVFRLGVASENGPNHPAPPEAAGLECDRMDPEAVREVFEGMAGRIVREARAKGYHSVQRFETDSYEAGFQDFCGDFPAQFRQRRGYDCTPWLPAWLDRNLVIGNAELCGRFRNDMLRTVSELWLERFYGELRRLAEEHQLQWMLEPYFLLNHDWRTAAARAHLAGSEFWMGGPQLIGPAPDSAALYDQKVVWAEAFTAESWESAWRNDPWRMKPFGDAAFCRGINHFVMHGFTHNPWDDRFQPGVTMGLWGTQMNRHATWWPYSRPWHRYLARCQLLLQQGHPIADVLAYPPKAEHIPGPVVDAGPFQQTVLNEETLLRRLTVHDGRLVLPDGNDYAALALAPSQALRPEELRKIRDLVQAGATVLGLRPPAHSASLENFPACDRVAAKLIEELWGKPGQPAQEKRKGRIIGDQPIASALDRLVEGPDFVCQPLYIPLFAQEPVITPRLLYRHRRSGQTDIYFLSNQEDRPLEIRADFRVAGRQPELWDPGDGAVRLLRDFHPQGKRTLIPLRLEPRQSFFVVFRLPTAASPRAERPNIPVLRQVFQLTGSWEVGFDPKRGGPERVTFDALADWTQRAEPGIQYYSGAATYQKEFDLPPNGGASSRLFLDLGTVRNLAHVQLNGQDLGVVWCAPWRVQISGGVKPLGNRLAIAVINTWANRLIGDEVEPEDCELVPWNPPERKGGYAMDVPGRGLRDLPDWLLTGAARPSSHRYTFTTWRYYPKGAPLLPSGLLGPVTILGEGESAEHK
ncbi:MAG: glycosyl hydrolase [Verrucomicrobiota bacterium]